MDRALVDQGDLDTVLDGGIAVHIHQVVHAGILVGGGEVGLKEGEAAGDGDLLQVNGQGLGLGDLLGGLFLGGDLLGGGFGLVRGRLLGGSLGLGMGLGVGGSLSLGIGGGVGGDGGVGVGVLGGLGAVAGHEGQGTDGQQDKGENEYGLFHI